MAKKEPRAPTIGSAVHFVHKRVGELASKVTGAGASSTQPPELATPAKDEKPIDLTTPEGQAAYNQALGVSDDFADTAVTEKDFRQTDKDRGFVEYQPPNKIKPK